MNKNIIIQMQIIAVLLGAPIFVFLDSPWFANHFFVGQDINNVIMFLMYGWIFYFAGRRLHWLMLIMIVASFCAEVIGSKILTLYRYHLDNIPPFIPLGHAVTYAIVFQISRQPFIWEYHVDFENFLRKFAFIVCFMSLILLNDVAGFLGYLFFLGILRQRKKPLFYLTMFAVTYYLEFLGTVFSAWSYYFALGNHPNYIPTSVTPCGIAGVYMLVDISSNSAYFYVKKLKKYLKKVRTSLHTVTPEKESIIQSL
ncbi:hypothetical protein [Legionella sainthelensi]|uniref:Uncharacterized protein n=1 Tax=Legionella sainthelensi TaxID=28087 RepID=A0A2H5FPU1_9GAMM|nr:hypothetical protein [Legionella sainthelensi]AUH73594.1 hypothetical protein CAB17_17225 [Legionella sainthelensi]